MWNKRLWNQILSRTFAAIFDVFLTAQHCPDNLKNNCLYHFNVFTGCWGHSWLTGLKPAADKRHYPVTQPWRGSQPDVISLPRLDLNHCNSNTLYQLTVKLISLDFGSSPQIRSDFCGARESWRVRRPLESCVKKRTESRKPGGKILNLMWFKNK